LFRKEHIKYEIIRVPSEFQKMMYQTALEAVAANASLNDVVRTRIYVTDITNWEKIGQAHLEFFKEIRPACTLVEVSHLISPEILVEMEADAIVA
jgi:enamine deaminase RidA (YjgF/YER057c/UK114 family)